MPPDTLVISPATGFAASGGVGGPFTATSQVFTLTNTSAGALTWSVGNPAAWLSASPSGGVLPAGSSTNLIVSLDSASSNLAPGLYTANFAVTNVTSNFVHLLPFSLQVHDPLVIVPTNGFNSAGPVGGPFSVTSLSLSLSNSGLASLNWSLSNNAPWLNASPGNGTLSVGASTTVTAGLNGVASNLPSALYSGNLIFSNLTGGLVQSVPFSLETGLLPLQNGGFELGNFTGWAVTGNTLRMLVTSNSMYVHSGVYGAELGSEGSLGYLSQTVPTSAGQVYLISFWLENEGVSGPDEFQVNWNGSTVLDEVNVGTMSWTNLQILVAATGTNSVLEFGERNDNSSFGLDDVQVFQSAVAGSPPTFTTQPTNETVTAGLTATFTAAASGIQPFYYQWQLGTSNIVGATNPTLVISPVTEGEAGNYSLVVSNAFGATNSSNAVLAVNVPVCDPPPSGLVSWWAAEGNANDSFGTNNGMLAGGVIFTNGEVGQAFSFDGTSGYVTVPYSPSFDFAPAGQFTLEAWVKPAILSQDQAIAVKSPANGNWDWGLYVTPGNQFASGYNGAFAVTSVTTAQAGRWYHVAVTYANGNWTLFVNGAVEAQDSGLFITQSTGAFAIARKGGTASPSAANPLAGLVDEVSIYNRALLPGEIASIYNAGSTGKCPVPPVIASQPQSQAVFGGSTASFSVSASGSQPLGYQWLVNESNIPTATNATLVLTNVQLGQSGNLYSVVVTNLGGSTNSSNALLTVLAPGTCDPPPSGLVSWWAAEGNANDSFGTNNGMLAGGVIFTNGEVGQAFSFDGTSGYVTVPYSPSFDFAPAGQFTLEAWVKPAILSRTRQSRSNRLPTETGIGDFT